MSVPATQSDQPQAPALPEVENTRKSLTDLNLELLSAIQNGISSVVGEARLSHENIDLEKIPSTITEKVKLEESRAQVTQSILDSWGGAGSNSGSTPSAEEIEQTRQTVKLYIEPIMSLACTEIIKALEADRDPSIAKKKRRAVTRTLRQLKRQASLYNLLGVKADATETEIKEAHKKLILLLHPDKNKDEAAGECTQAINGAKDTLADAGKRKDYDLFLKSKPQAADEEDEMEVDEDFAPNAFDSDESDDDMEEEEADDEEEDEKEFTKPSKTVDKEHRAMGPIIKKFFKDLEGQIAGAELAKALSRKNSRIQKDNQSDPHRQGDINIFTVPADKLLVCQYMQRNIALTYNLGIIQPDRVQNELQSLQNYFEKACRRGLHQWPEAWVGYLMDPLRERLLKIGLSQQYTETKTGPKPSPSKQSDNSSTKDKDKDKDKDEYSRGCKTPSFKQAQAKTLHILAHSYPLRRNAIPMGFAGMKYFLDVDGPNRLALQMAADVDKTKELEYQQSTTKHNIKEHEHMHAMRPVTDFKKIIGVAFLAGTGSSERTPWTYVRVQMTDDTDYIMTRSSLRGWLNSKNADRHIDQFCVDSGTVPPWVLGHEDSYTPLMYPLPTRSDRKDQIALRRYPDRLYNSPGNGIEMLTERMEALMSMLQTQNQSMQLAFERLLPMPKNSN
ncbi:hypothetical protein F5Y16DRAFT_393143 [Xylariaceae sp. FL0255]|nr:hypothetical protein F5Y16DRAFT_393143 [Xylariaceae sp. FL0255]